MDRVSTRFILKSHSHAIIKNSSQRVIVKNRVYMRVIASNSFKMCNTSELDQVKLAKEICFIESLYAIDASII